ERSGSGGDDYVVDEERPPARPDAPVDADVLADVRLEEQPFQGFGVVEAKEVHVEEHLELRRDLDVRAQVEQEEPGVDEVRLALELAGSETGHEAVAAFELEPRVGQRQALAHPVAEAAAGEIRVVEDHVEATRRVVVGLSIARRPEERDPWPEPVEVDG